MLKDLYFHGKSFISPSLNKLYVDVIVCLKFV